MNNTQTHIGASYKPTKVVADIIDGITSVLPELPKKLRYYDDFESTFFTINDFSNQPQIVLRQNGRQVTTYFDFDGKHSSFSKHLFLFMLQENFNIVTVCQYVSYLRTIPIEEIKEYILISPELLKSRWSISLSQNRHSGVYSVLKILLKMLCTYGIGRWTDSHFPLISSLPFPFVDKHAAVRLGEVFITIDEESRMVSFIDEFAITLEKSGDTVSDSYLEDAAMFMCCYLYGLRPIQIASVVMRDVRIWNELADGETSVHITFKTVKQKSSSKAFPLVRKIKYEWTIIIIELFNRHKKNEIDWGARFFGAESARAASVRIGKFATKFADRNLTARHLRHSAAQRMVDAGANREELAVFMGHTDITTGDVYFSASPNQNELVNIALGLSDIYQPIAQIWTKKFISPEDLKSIEAEKQIGGAPHGMLIAGIGACSSGQSVCQFNPVTSCYGCHKFMPVLDTNIHLRVMEDMRNVVHFYRDASRNAGESPTFLQLKRTIGQIQKVVEQLEGDSND